MILNYTLMRLFYTLAIFVAHIAASEAIISGGLVMTIDQFAYQVSVQIPVRGHVCGGGIIGARFVLTAAHCVVNENDQLVSNRIAILAGTKDLNRMSKPAEIVDVKTIYVPTEYKPKYGYSSGDIAVLKLKDRLKISRLWSTRSNLKRLKLPKNRQEIYDGQTAIISGFGWNSISLNNRTFQESGASDGHLRFAETDVLKTKQCQKNYYYRKISGKELCAKVKQRNDFYSSGTCNGDNGGPLVNTNDGKTIIGVLSDGPFGCTEREKSGIYTRVTNYLDFIRDAMRDEPYKNMRKYEVQKESY